MATGDPRSTGDTKSTGDPNETPVAMKSSDSVSGVTSENPINSAAQSQLASKPNSSPAANGSSLSLIIIDYPASFESSAGWVTRLRERFAHEGFSDLNNPVLFLLVCPEDPRLTSESLARSGADDLIMKPVDRSLFLQKLEILFARGGSVSPTYLYRMKADGGLEIAKSCLIEELSEVGLSIRNQLMIRTGVYATLYSDFFGDGEDAKVNLKVIKSELTDDPDQAWRVKMVFFGLNNRQLLRVRQQMKSVPRPPGNRKSKKPQMPLPYANVKDVKIHPPISSDENIQSVRLAVIDLGREIHSSISSSLDEHVQDLQLVTFKSPSRLLASLRGFRAQQMVQSQVSIDHSGSQLPSSSVAMQGATHSSAIDGAIQSVTESSVGEVSDSNSGTVELFPKDQKVEVLVRGDDGSVVEVDSQLPDEALFLGFPIKSFSERSSQLMSMVHQDDLEEMKEFISFVSNGEKAECAIRIRLPDVNSNQQQEPKERIEKIVIKGERVKAPEGPDPAFLNFAFAQWQPDSVHEGGSSGGAVVSPEALRFDMIAIHASFLMPEPEVRIQQIRQEFVSAGLYQSLDQVPEFFVFADETSRVTPEKFRLPGVVQFAWKDLEGLRLVEAFFQLLPSKVWKDDDLQIRRVPCRIAGHLARTSQMEELSEFGLSIRDVTPFKPGTILRFFSPIFGRQDKGVLARCVAAREAEETWINEFVFFGSSDEFQKQIRQFTREEYARKKSQEAG
jgi:hypothetical protein